MYTYPVTIDFGGRTSRIVKMLDSKDQIICNADGAVKSLRVSFTEADTSYQIRAGFWITSPITVSVEGQQIASFQLDSTKLRSRSLTILDTSDSEIGIIRAGGSAKASGMRVATFGLAAAMMKMPAFYSGTIDGQEFLTVSGDFPKYQLLIDSNTQLTDEVERLILVALIFVMRAAFTAGGEQIR